MSQTTPAQTMDQGDTSWMDDLYSDPTPAPAPAAPQPPAPAAPRFTAPPAQPQATPYTPQPDIAAIAHARSAQAPASPPAPPAAPTLPSYDATGIDFTPEEQAQLAATGAGPLLEKVARRAVADYDRRVGEGLRGQVSTIERERQQQAQEVSRVAQTANARALQARFPDLDALRQRPEWADFANTQIMTPAGYVPRQVALSMAADSGNYAYIDAELAAFRQQGVQPQAVVDPFAPAASTQQGAYQVPAAAPRTAPGGAPAPTLAQLSQSGRTLSSAKVQAKLQELSARVSLNPRDTEARQQYDTLSREARAAHFERRLV